jgi:hypothetical protein
VVLTAESGGGRSPLSVAPMRVHQLRRDRPDGLADHIGVLVEQHLPDDLLDRHPVRHRPCGASFRRVVRSPTNFQRLAGCPSSAIDSSSQVAEVPSCLGDGHERHLNGGVDFPARTLDRIIAVDPGGAGVSRAEATVKQE